CASWTTGSNYYFAYFDFG
nr:immunoglobulin heavy chain junction region [Macaca mulatta]